MKSENSLKLLYHTHAASVECFQCRLRLRSQPLQSVTQDSIKRKNLIAIHGVDEADIQNILVVLQTSANLKEFIAAAALTIWKVFAAVCIMSSISSCTAVIKLLLPYNKGKFAWKVYRS